MQNVTVASEGAKLLVSIDGRGPLVVLLHGPGGAGAACAGLAGPLVAAGFRAAMPDLRGSGRSHDGRELGWERLGRDVVAVMDELGAERAVVVGLSGGCGAALRAALDAPGRVRALGLVRPAHGGADAPLTAAQAAAFAGMRGLTSRAPSEGVDVLRPMFDGLPEPIRSAALAMLPTLDAESVAATGRFLASGAQPFGAGTELAAIAVPTLVIPGADMMHPPEVAAHLAAHIAGAEVAAVPEAEEGAALAAFCARLG